MTATEILNYVSERMEVVKFADGEFDDQTFFDDYSDELKKHIEACEDLNWREEEQYAHNNLGGKQLYTLKEEEFKAAGSPKSPLGEWKEVEQYGGEGQGDTWYSIKHFIDHDVYIRTDGYYSSYNGTDFNDGYGHEVRPAQKTITVYE